MHPLTSGRFGEGHSHTVMNKLREDDDEFFNHLFFSPSGSISLNYCEKNSQLLPSLHFRQLVSLTAERCSVSIMKRFKSAIAIVRNLTKIKKSEQRTGQSIEAE